MPRACFLVVDQEYPGSISTRKLVIETAKLNVITAYSSAEAISTLRRYPAVDGVVMDAGMPDMACDDLVTQLKSVRADLPIIVVGRPGSKPCDQADHHLESFEPQKLLALVQKLRPEDTARIEKRNEALAAQR